jgi:DNA-binding CsgD family transcriptional regulator
MPGHAPTPPTCGGDSAKKLTAAERTILRALRNGLTPSQVAATLERSELTVRTHIRNARAKLDIRATGELLRLLANGELDEQISELG